MAETEPSAAGGPLRVRTDLQFGTESMSVADVAQVWQRLMFAPNPGVRGYPDKAQQRQLRRVFLALAYLPSAYPGRAGREQPLAVWASLGGEAMINRVGTADMARLGRLLGADTARAPSASTAAAFPAAEQTAARNAEAARRRSWWRRGLDRVARLLGRLPGRQPHRAPSIAPKVSSDAYSVRIAVDGTALPGVTSPLGSASTYSFGKANPLSLRATEKDIVDLKGIVRAVEKAGPEHASRLFGDLLATADAGERRRRLTEFLNLSGSARSGPRPVGPVRAASGVSVVDPVLSDRRGRAATSVTMASKHSGTPRPEERRPGARPTAVVQQAPQVRESRAESVSDDMLRAQRLARQIGYLPQEAVERLARHGTTSGGRGNRSQVATAAALTSRDSGTPGPGPGRPGTAAPPPAPAPARGPVHGR